MLSVNIVKEFTFIGNKQKKNFFISHKKELTNVRCPLAENWRFVNYLSHIRKII